jgi:hypothetical protein
MPGFDWNGNGKKDSFDHFMDNKVMSETSDDKNNPSSGSGNKKNNNSGKGLNFGWGWGVIVIVAFFLISFIADGASWDAIDTLLGLGLLAFLFFRWIST